MECSRIILGQKAYKELNPSSKEKGPPPLPLPPPLTFTPLPFTSPAVASQAAVGLFTLYLPINLHSFLQTPFYIPSLGLSG